MTEYLYAYVTCGRKAWHLGSEFSDWEEIAFERGSYVEHVTFRKPLEIATEHDRQLAKDYAEKFTSDPE